MERPHKDEEIIHKIDESLLEETTLAEGLRWACNHNWMSEEEAEECLRAYLNAAHSVDIPEF